MRVESTLVWLVRRCALVHVDLLALVVVACRALSRCVVCTTLVVDLDFDPTCLKKSQRSCARGVLRARLLGVRAATGRDRSGRADDGADERTRGTSGRGRADELSRRTDTT